VPRIFVTRGRSVLVIAGLAGALVAASQPDRSHDGLIAALEPALPYPASTPGGDVPANNDVRSPWFVIWPSPEDPPRVVVRANPLHPDTQKAGAEAMARIQQAVEAAERKAQAEYDRVLAEVKKSGIGSDVEGISLDDEGVAGERIDADLELTIELQPIQTSTALSSSMAPTIAAGSDGPAWIVSMPANVYREGTGKALRERFRPAEARLYFDVRERPSVTRVGPSSFVLGVGASSAGRMVVLRGNEKLLDQVVATARWAALTRSQHFH
jgi:hypothetical protein